ncbi:MAG: hypothetical protein EXS08_02990 [Planctomycetes bacterium]|nr:hypothetical protein [Planctomycetota bacterium]
MLTWSRRFLVGVAALLLLVMASLVFVEQSGLLTRWVRERLARELGAAGARLTLVRAELTWFEPGLELSGLAFASPDEAGADELLLERVHVVLEPRLDGLRALRIQGGHLLLGPRLLADLQTLVGPHLRTSADAAPPPVSVSALELSLELADRSRFQLGRVELCARPLGPGRLELAGRLAPSLGGVFDAEQPIRLSGEVSDESVRLWAAARELELATRSLPGVAQAARLPLEEGSVQLSLDASFELSRRAAVPSHGHLRASLQDGRARLSDGLPPIDAFAAELEADFAPGPGLDVEARAAWAAWATLSARAGETPLELAAELGREVPNGAWLRAWGQAAHVSIERADLAAVGLEHSLAYVREMLDPHGHVDMAGTLTLGRDAQGWTRDLALAVRAQGEVSLTYAGYPGDPRGGLALPLTGVRGELLLGDDSTRPYPLRLSVRDISAQHGSGTLQGWTQVLAPPHPGPLALPEFDLVLSTPSLAISPALSAALQGNQHLEWIVPSFAPEGGTLAGDFRLRTGPELGGTSGAGTFQVHGTSLRWSEMPVQMDGVNGELALRWAREVAHRRDDPLLKKRAFGVAYSFDNRGAEGVGAQARVHGWVREEALPPVFEHGYVAPLLQELAIDIDALRLKGRDFDVLASRFPTLQREVADYGAVGRMHVRFRGAHPSVSAPFATAVEGTPLEVHVQPQFFQRQVRDLHGRILIQTAEQGEEVRSSSQLCLAGSWPSGVELFARGAIPEVGPARVHVYGAGIDATNTSFKGALVTTLASGGTGQGIDLSSWTLAGPVDFALETEFDPASPAPPKNRYRIQLRHNDLSAREFQLHDLHGTLTQQDEILTSPRVRATLAGHPLELTDVLTFPLAALARVSAADPWLAREGFWSDANGRALQAELSTRNLPLDADHLAGILSPSALEALRSNPSWRGALDVLGARLLVTSEADKRGKVALRGAMRAHDLELSLGLPIRIAEAKIALEELLQESNRTRGWARIDGLQATIAERELNDASMIAGYVDGRLTIDNLSGDFEGGRLESLGGVQGGASKALGVDLSEPYRFDVGLRLERVSVAGLLRGVFQSSIADEGFLDAALQLSGTPGEVLALVGRGSLSLDDGALWSIPVMRELFLQLGFDRTGLFDRLRSRFELRDGRIQVSHLEIRSALLDLVGQGWQDLDGRLAYDLEVRYGLLEHFGVLSRILYWLNNNLWRVAVRGDFERPEVTIRNSILEWIRSFDDDPERRLPLPHFSALGPRF